jgi:predicted transcriptional regulator
MTSEKIKEYLLQIAGNVSKETRLDDIYEQLALLNDIDESEEEEKRGEVLSHQEVISRSNQWLK